MVQTLLRKHPPPPGELFSKIFSVSLYTLYQLFFKKLLKYTGCVEMLDDIIFPANAPLCL
jgi:hypothetical protein